MPPTEIEHCIMNLACNILPKIHYKTTTNIFSLFQLCTPPVKLAARFGWKSEEAYPSMHGFDIKLINT